MALTSGQKDYVHEEVEELAAHLRNSHEDEDYAAALRLAICALQDELTNFKGERDAHRG
jgi:Holliday junction resolvasome RuvABC endonuclease subunit